MKLHKYITTLLALIATTQFASAETGANFSAGYSYGSYSANAFGQSIDDDVDGFNLRLGFDLNDSWSVEGRYRSLEAESVPVSLDEIGFYASYNVDLGDFSTAGIIGGFGNRELSASGVGSVSYDAGILGLDLETYFTDSLRGKVEYAYFVATERDSVDISEIEVSLSYSIDGIYELFVSYRDQVTGDNFLHAEGIFTLGIGFDI